ncbi:expressed unknown protein [Ectocarpus siliculosus]|uniref:Uncharacterized protein n=1 Tax=Ectocarpus siliculosus TaxID=2880 RepID=D8LCM1_ECTSI|nr:expressed unknown protein [Ectocarpus siliculosus]|eukprot:CBN79534.1 expressed unknown protein [Ectocarpus siliculosus]
MAACPLTVLLSSVHCALLCCLLLCVERSGSLHYTQERGSGGCKPQGKRFAYAHARPLSIPASSLITEGRQEEGSLLAIHVDTLGRVGVSTFVGGEGRGGTRLYINKTESNFVTRGGLVQHGEGEDLPAPLRTRQS